ncbi:uncharacterized protein [Miscanthus floridulus]|uniref:uncharacterized protein n=1 Tax=Miscanthus floridulus TaxID=154761 RepID=UPI003458F99B
MAEAQALVLAQGPDEAPLDASAIRSRVEQLSLERRRRGEGEEEEKAEVALGLDSPYKVAQEAMDEWHSTTAAASIDDLDAYLEMLRKDVAMAEQANQKVSAEISVTAETTFNDMIQVDVGIEMLESLSSNLGPKVSS